MVLIFAILVFLVTRDWVEDGYKSIRPLHTSKAAVEKVLGKAEVDDNGYYTYSTTDAYIRIDYSTEPCRVNQFGRGEFRVPAETVLTYHVLPKNQPNICEFTFNREKFQRFSSEHLLNYASYINPDKSISILVMIKRARDEVVYEIEYRPTEEDLGKLKCQ